MKLHCKIVLVSTFLKLLVDWVHAHVGWHYLCFCHYTDNCYSLP